MAVWRPPDNSSQCFLTPCEDHSADGDSFAARPATNRLSPRRSNAETGTQCPGPNANFGFVELLMVQIAVSDLLDKVRQQIENMALRQRPTLVDLP
jgi:hypothetical protein